MQRLIVAILWLSSMMVIRGGIFSSKGDVQVVDVVRLKKLLAGTSKGTMVAFYAPWCGHCRNLVPEYQKAATNVKDLVHFVAVDCDAAENKAACNTDYHVRGFPTLAFFPGVPVPSPYNAERKAKPLVDFALQHMPNFARKIKTDEELSKLVSKSTTARPLVVLFTEATKTTPLFKALSSVVYKKMDVYTATPTAIGAESAREKYAVSTFPTLMLFKGPDQSARHTFSGKMSYKTLLDFFKANAPPKQDENKPKKESPGKASGEL